MASCCSVSSLVWQVTQFVASAMANAVGASVAVAVGSAVSVGARVAVGGTAVSVGAVVRGAEVLVGAAAASVAGACATAVGAGAAPPPHAARIRRPDNNTPRTATARTHDRDVGDILVPPDVMQEPGFDRWTEAGSTPLDVRFDYRRRSARPAPARPRPASSRLTREAPVVGMVAGAAAAAGAGAAAAAATGAPSRV